MKVTGEIILTIKIIQISFSKILHSAKIVQEKFVKKTNKYSEKNLLKTLNSTNIFQKKKFIEKNLQTILKKI